MKFKKSCNYCGESFRPVGRREYICHYCIVKGYRYNQLCRNIEGVKRVLFNLLPDKNKKWYKEIEKALAILEINAKEIRTKELSKNE